MRLVLSGVRPDTVRLLEELLAAWSSGERACEVVVRDRLDDVIDEVSRGSRRRME
jgi:hypothetical protein